MPLIATSWLSFRLPGWLAAGSLPPRQSCHAILFSYSVRLRSSSFHIIIIFIIIIDDIIFQSTAA